jgi:hypothetical protein
MAKRMKRQITTFELQQLDLISIAADRLRDQQDILIDLVCSILDVEDWDEQKRDAIGLYIRCGKWAVETFLEDLGVGDK